MAARFELCSEYSLAALKQESTNGNGFATATLALLYLTQSVQAGDPTSAKALLRTAASAHPVVALLRDWSDDASKPESEARVQLERIADGEEEAGTPGTANAGMALACWVVARFRLFDRDSPKDRQAQAGKMLSQWFGVASPCHGFAPGVTQLACCLFQGRGGLPHDPALAHRLFRRAAEQGLARAQYLLGSITETGVPEARLYADLGAAAALYRKSAEDDNNPFEALQDFACLPRDLAKEEEERKRVEKESEENAIWGCEMDHDVTAVAHPAPKDGKVKEPQQKTCCLM